MIILGAFDGRSWVRPLFLENGATGALLQLALLQGHVTRRRRAQDREVDLEVGVGAVFIDPENEVALMIKPCMLSLLCLKQHGKKYFFWKNSNVGPL